MRYRKRHKMSRKSSRRHFSKNAGYHPRNGGRAVMRGGIRF